MTIVGSRKTPIDTDREKTAANANAEAVQFVTAYHNRSKHSFEAYAPSPQFLDWESQPDPFRRFEGAPLIPLPLVEEDKARSYDSLFELTTNEVGDATLEELGRFFELSLGLSVWKQSGPDRWALRNNPSSGNLHPTEGYLLLFQKVSKELEPGLYHYAPHEHALEYRAPLSEETANALQASHPKVFGAFAFSSIHWREEWKYGLRAYRYCQHDVGHALAAASFAARLNNWNLYVDWSCGDKELSALLGHNRDEDFAGAEGEHPDLVALLCRGDNPAPLNWPKIINGLGPWKGQANRLSEEHVKWRQIEKLLPFLEKPGHIKSQTTAKESDTVAPEHVFHTSAPAERIIRNRRSAQRMDGKSSISIGAFEQILLRTLPHTGATPFDTFQLSPAINLLLFVHRVEGLSPGFYLLDRCPDRFTDFKKACGHPSLTWTQISKTSLRLYALTPDTDVTKHASKLCCYQAIAGHSAFSLGMIADFEQTLSQDGAWAYRRLFWEAGLIGQVLYLEAEAAGLRGTGIGCYFDDAVHDLLGIGSSSAPGSWQSLYHFTIGGPIEDTRLQSDPPYAHLRSRLKGKCDE